MANEPKVIFLHIPKTAGQSVHEFLLANFDRESVCPARVNEQLKLLSAEELNRYQVFSGHFDWSAFDRLEGERFVFTVLRDPMERLLSFYFYLREQAELFASRGELGPDKVGMRAALEMTPWEYFVDPQSKIRGFIDNHYDNFYTCFFAGRRYNARPELLRLTGTGKLFASMDDVARLALCNLATLDAVLPIERWFLLVDALSDALGRKLSLKEEIRVNTGKVPPQQRQDRLHALGAEPAVFERLRSFCDWDEKIMAKATQQSPVS